MSTCDINVELHIKISYDSFQADFKQKRQSTLKIFGARFNSSILLLLFVKLSKENCLKQRETRRQTFQEMSPTENSNQCYKNLLFVFIYLFFSLGSARTSHLLTISYTATMWLFIRGGGGPEVFGLGSGSGCGPGPVPPRPPPTLHPHSVCSANHVFAAVAC
jgi:hypothetical protein